MTARRKGKIPIEVRCRDGDRRKVIDEASKIVYRSNLCVSAGETAARELVSAESRTQTINLIANCLGYLRFKGVPRSE